MQNILLLNAKELAKSSCKKLFFFAYLLSIFGCEDKSYFIQTYDEKLLSKQTTCLQLKLNPYSDEIYNGVKNLYDFDDNCTRTLEIKYKTQIICNSSYNVNKNFHSFVQLDLLENNKLIYTIYKDLQDENITNEIQKGYKILCKTINL